MAIRRYRFPWSLCEKGPVTSIAILSNGTYFAVMHLALIPVPGAATGCTGVTLPALLLNIIHCLRPVAPLSDFIQGLLDTHITSWQSTMYFSQLTIHSVPMENNLGYFWSSTGWIPSGSPVCRSSLVPVALVCWAAVGDVFPFWALSSLYFLQNGPYILVVHLFYFQRGWIPAGCGYSCNSLYLFDFCLCFDFMAPFSAWSLWKGIDTVMFLA